MLAVHDVELDSGYLFARRDARVLDWRNPEPQTDARSHPVPLATAWPMLRLSQDAVERVRPSAGATDPSPTAPSEPGPVHEQAPLSAPAPVPALAPAPAVAVAAAGVPSLSAPALVHPSHAATNGLRSAEPPSVAAREGVLVPMPERVLSVPAAVASISEAIGGAPDEIDAMDRRLPADDGAVPERQRGGHGRLPGCGRAGPSWSSARRPLVGTIVSLEPETELVTTPGASTHSDRYLLDHTLGRAVSRTDAALTRWR